MDGVGREGDGEMKNLEEKRVLKLDTAHIQIYNPSIIIFSSHNKFHCKRILYTFIILYLNSNYNLFQIAALQLIDLSLHCRSH